jgi:hypothetical protein
MSVGFKAHHLVLTNDFVAVTIWELFYANLVSKETKIKKITLKGSAELKYLKVTAR